MPKGKKEAAIVRFHRAYRVDQNTGCWIWTKATSSYGYGILRIDGRTKLAHRFSYELFIAAIDPGRYICHRCDTPSCVNPEHLFSGSAMDNTHDMLQKGRFVKPNVRLTAEIVAQIRKEAAVDTQRVIAKRHGLTQGHVCRIVNRQIWP